MRHTQTPAEYRAAYQRGWNASQKYTITKDGRTPIERADDRNEPHAWYDGFDDNSCQLPKFHSQTCKTNCETCEGAR